MKLSEDEAKRFLERLCPLQETEQQLLCPRCGRNELYSGLYFFLNSLSRYAHVYICEKCWMDEALREIDGNPVPLTRWNAVLPFVLRGEIPPSDSSCQDTNASAGPRKPERFTIAVRLCKTRSDQS